MANNSILRSAPDEDRELAPLRSGVEQGITPELASAVVRGQDTQFTKGFRTGVSGISAGRLASEALRTDSEGDPDRAARLNAEALQLQEESRANAPRVQSLRDIANANDAFDFATGSFGQGLASMTPTLAAAILSRGRGPLGSAASFLGGAGTAFELERGEAALGQASDPKLRTASVEDRNLAANVKGGINAVFETAVPFSLAKSLFRKPAGTFGKEVLKNTLEEGATETAQQAVGFGAEKFLDPTRKLDPVDLADAFAAGALTGGGTSAAVRAPAHGAQALADRVTRSRQDEGPVNEPAADTVPPDVGMGDLVSTLNERFGPDLREQAGKAKDIVSGTIRRANEAAKTARSPQEFIRDVFSSAEDVAAADLRPDTEDPSVLNSEDPAAAIQQRDQEKAARGKAFYEELLNDPATPATIKERLAGMNPDDPVAQRFATQNLVAQRAGEKLFNAVTDLSGLVKDLGGKALTAAGPKISDLTSRGKELLETTGLSDKGEEALRRGGELVDNATDRIIKRKNNLQDIPPEAMQPLVSALAQRLGAAHAAESPKLAQQLVAVAARLTPTMRITEDVDRRLRNLSKVVDDDMLNLITEAVGSDGMRGAIARIRAIPNAQNDVSNAGGHSFLESLLTTQTSPQTTGKIAEYVDELGLKLQGMNVTQKTNALNLLVPVFGSVKNAQTVVEYYGALRAAAIARDAETNPGEDDRPEGDTLGLELGSEAGPDALTETDPVRLRAQFRAPNPARPFFRVTDQAELRKARREAGPGSRVMTLREFIATTDESPQFVAARVRNDLLSRLRNEENRDTASVQQALRDLDAVPEDLRDNAFNELRNSLQSRKTEDRPNLPKLRKQLSVLENAAGVSFSDIKQLTRRIQNEEDAVKRDLSDGSDLPKLRKQLDKLEQKHSANADKVLDRVAVVVSADSDAVVGSKDRGASDERMAKFRSLLDRTRPPPTRKPGESINAFNKRKAENDQHNADIRATRIGFKMKGSKQPLYLSAESMVMNSAIRGTPGQRLAESISEVLARSDVENLIAPDPDTIILRRGDNPVRWRDAGLLEGGTVRLKKSPERQKADEVAVDDVQAFVARNLANTTPEEKLDRMLAAAQKIKARGLNTLRNNALLRQFNNYIYDNILPDVFPLSDRNALEETVAEAETEAGQHAPEGNVFVDLRVAEDHLETLEQWREAVKGNDALVARVDRRIAAIEREIDTLIDSVPVTKRVRDVLGSRALPDEGRQKADRADEDGGESSGAPAAAETPTQRKEAKKSKDIAKQLEKLAAKQTESSVPGRVVLPGKGPFLAKDQAKSDKANKFIGRGVEGSSTAAYARAWGPLANTGKYSENDVVFVSVNGNRPGAQSPNFAEIKRALTAGATIVADAKADRARPFNTGERAVAEFLEKNGYEESAPGTWTPKGKKSAQAPKRGRPGKIDEQGIIDEIRRIRGDDVKVAFETFAEIGGSGEFSMSADQKNRLIRIATNAANPLGVAWHESLHDFFAMLGEVKVGRTIKRDLVDAANAPHVKKRLRELLSGHPEALKQVENDAEERVAYMYQFWAEGLVTLGPTGTGIFQRVRQFLRDIAGVIGLDQRAGDLLTALHEGRFANPSVVAEVLADLPADRLINKLDKAAPALTHAMSALFKTAPDRLRSFQNDKLNELADRFSSETGKLGFIQRRFQQGGVWENALAGVLAGSTAAQRRAALENMQAMKPPSNELEKNLAKYFQDIHKYMTEAGVKTFDAKTKEWVPIRRVKNFFPRVFDRSVISDKRDEFVALLQKHGAMDARQANTVVDALVHGSGQLELVENSHALGFTPFAPSVQNRQFTFIDPSNAAEFAKFQVKDLADITTGYTKQAVHRAEYARDFDNDGSVITSMIAVSRISDPGELAEIGKIVQGLEGSLGNEMSSSTKELMSGLMTLQNVILLPLSIFSQMIDPIVLAARSGELRDAGRAYMIAINRLIGNKVDGEELADILGIVSQDSVLEAMGNAYGTTFMSGRMRKINQVFFKYNGMQGWNNSMRIAATAAGERYLVANKGDQKALDELGLVSADVRLDSNGRLDTSSKQIREAMFRFVDQAVLRPSASNRPVWMSDPRFLLVAHLKQFTFAMQNVVLKRANQQLADGNPKPWGILALAMPTILAADMAKFALSGNTPVGWGFRDHLVHAVNRSGLLGIGDFGTQAFSGVGTAGKAPGEELLGPTFEHMMELLRFVGGDPRTGVSDVVERTVPGARFI